MVSNYSCGGRVLREAIGLTVLVLLLAGDAGALIIEERNKSFEETYTDYGKSVYETSDGDYVIADLSNSYGSGNTDVWMIKVSDEVGGGDISDCTNLGTPGTYVLSRNIMNSSTSTCISITSNDVIFDGAGYTIDGQDTFNTIGVNVYSLATTLTNVTIKNLMITDWYSGINIRNVQNGSINNNTISSNDYFRCLSTDCRTIYAARGIQISGSSTNYIFNNNIHLNPEGLLLLSASNNSIQNNRVLLNNLSGIGVFGSSNNSIKNNSIENNSNGISLGRQFLGEEVRYSNKNTITGNTLKSNNWNGIVFDYSSNNSINKNVIIKNKIMLISSINNIFYHNDFINDNKHIYDNLSINSWDSGYPSGGNYWNDYKGIDLKSGPNQDQSGSDGIGDTLFSITGSALAIDRYPLIIPFTLRDDITSPVITDFKVPPNTSINSTNPAVASASVSDVNLKSVAFGIIDKSNLLDTNMTIFGIHINESGVSGMYVSKQWAGYALWIKNATKEDIVTGIVNENLPDYNLVPGSFKKNYSTVEEEAVLWFNGTTGNLSKITRMNSPSTLVIESGRSTLRVSKLKLVNGWGSEPSFINGTTFTLYNIGNQKNPHIIMKPVPSGIYSAFVRAEDIMGNSNGTFVNVGVSINTITITSPNGGQIWPRGTSQTIRWNYSGTPGSCVKIEMLKNEKLNRIINKSVLIGRNGSGSYRWQINSTQTLGSDYRIRINSTTYPAYTDTSNNNFTINGDIRVTSPDGGEVWQRGTTHRIRWNYTGSPGSRVRIELLKNGTFNRVINSSTLIGSSSSGSYNWQINSTLTPGKFYKIRVNSTTNPAYTDTSNNSFTVS